MKKYKSFDSKIYTLIRISSILCAIIIFLVNIYILLHERRFDKIFSKLSFTYRLFNTICVEIFLIILIIFPYKFESIAIYAFLYTGILLYSDPLNILSVPMYFLGILSLYKRGLLRKYKAVKITILSLGAVILLFSNLRYGTVYFLEDFGNKICCMLICFLIFIFVLMDKNTNRENTITLDLSRFPELTERDKEWVELALSQEKYDSIARKYNLSPNYVKNRMRVIFKIIGVPDRLALLAAYSGCSIKK